MSSPFSPGALQTQLEQWSGLVGQSGHRKSLKTNMELDVFSLESLEMNAKMNIFITEAKGKTDIPDT